MQCPLGLEDFILGAHPESSESVMTPALVATLLLALGGSDGSPATEDDLEGAYADSHGVRIHYVEQGDGPLVILIHGFPDYWYTWRHQMPALAEHFRVVAIDQRGYNRSDKPEGVDAYKMEHLVNDVEAVIDEFGEDRATVVGHDWGGMVAWNFAMHKPDRIDRLVILNLPHPKCLARELATNPAQQRNSQYARNFQKEGVEKAMRPEMLVGWVQDEDARKKYTAAMKRSSMAAMLAYYKANYPREPYTDDVDFPPVKCRVLQFHGLKDQYLLHGALNDTWKYVEKDLTLLTIPDAGHFVQHEATDFVTTNMVRWLLDGDER